MRALIDSLMRSAIAPGIFESALSLLIQYWPVKWPHALKSTLNPHSEMLLWERTVNRAIGPSQRHETTLLMVLAAAWAEVTRSCVAPSAAACCTP